jgi:Secretion system C-terminal sorting domain
LSGLTAGGCYQYRLRNRFPSGLFSNFTNLRQFCLPLLLAGEAEKFVENDLTDRNNDVISIEYNVPDLPESMVGKAASKLDFTISPNPTEAEIFIHFESINVDKPLIINVLNISGKKIISQFFENTTDLLEQKMDTELLPSGLYLLEIQNGDARKVVKFVKI